MERLLHGESQRPIMDRLRSLRKRFLARAVLDPLMSTVLSRTYSVLSAESRGRLHRRLAKIFVGHPGHPEAEASWTLEFAGRQVRMPIRGSNLALDWDNLLSLLGAEIEVKEAYRGWLTGPPGERPEVFVDCGASYGTHSLLWGAHDVPVVAFEPNPECHATFDRLMAQLPTKPRLNRCAVGARRGEAELRFPADETWVGRVMPVGKGPATTSQDTLSAWRSVQVQVMPLDDFRDTIPPGRLLLKLDVEGFELETLRGATRLLAERRPLIVVESWNGPARGELRGFLEEAGYAMAPLPTPSGQGPEALNFLAAPVA